MSSILGNVSDFKLGEMSQNAEDAGKVGKALDEAHEALFAEFRKDDPTEEKIAELQAELQKRQRTFSAMTNILRSMHETLMEVIRNIRAR